MRRMVTGGASVLALPPISDLGDPLLFEAILEEQSEDCAQNGQKFCQHPVLKTRAQPLYACCLQPYQSYSPREEERVVRAVL